MKLIGYEVAMGKIYGKFETTNGVVYEVINPNRLIELIKKGE